MKRYTLDAVGVLRYAVGELPDAVLDVFRAAAAGDAVVQVPAIALAEAMYKFDEQDTVSGHRLSRPPEDVPDLVTSDMPATVVETTLPEIRRLAELLGEHSIHDAMIVASHEVRDTDAVITTDSNVRDAVPTVWDGRPGQ